MKLRKLGVSLLLILAGCGSPGGSGSFPAAPSGNTGSTTSLVSTKAIEAVSPDAVMQTHLRSMEVLGKVIDRTDGIGDDVQDGSTLDSIWSYVTGFFGRYVRYSIRTHSVTYRTRSASGKEQVVSGLLVVPYQPPSVPLKGETGGSLRAPVLSLQHPTQVERKYSPSMETLADNELTYQSACLFAACGYIVVVADYPGLGVNTDVHPYCQESLGNSVVDLILIGENHPALAEVQTSWNGQLYMMGYSEGGYATLVAAKQLQAQGIRPNAAATLDGPLSLSQAMRKVMLEADATYSAPYFLPYVVSGYGSIYSSTVPELSYDQAVIPSVPGYPTFPQQLWGLLDGSHSGEEISTFMKLATPYQGPRSILTGTFQANLGNVQSPVVQTLAANDSYRNWTPAFSLRMFHNRLDDLVPVDNTREAAQAFNGLSNVTAEEYLLYIPGLGSIHAGALPVAYVLGFNWIDALAYPQRHL